MNRWPLLTRIEYFGSKDMLLFWFQRYFVNVILSARVKRMIRSRCLVRLNKSINMISRINLPVVNSNWRVLNLKRYISVTIIEISCRWSIRRGTQQNTRYTFIDRYWWHIRIWQCLTSTLQMVQNYLESCTLYRSHKTIRLEYI